MTIHIVTAARGNTGRKKRLGLCVTPRCTRPPRANERLCARCRDRIWRARHPEHHLWNNLKKSAKRRGIPFTITLEEFTDFCRRENFVARVGRGAENATVDRIDAARGYSIDNLRVLSNAENGRLGQPLAGTGHRAEASHYTEEEDPLRC